MGFWIFMLCCDELIPLTMIGFGWIFLNKPPKNINGIYGYRTARSMASKEAWDFAHKYMGKLWFRLGWVCAIFSTAAMLLCIGKDDNTVSMWGSIVCIVGTVLMILPIIPTEKALKTTFGA